MNDEPVGKLISEIVAISCTAIGHQKSDLNGISIQMNSPEAGEPDNLLQSDAVFQ